MFNELYQSFYLTHSSMNILQKYVLSSYNFSFKSKNFKVFFNNLKGFNVPAVDLTAGNCLKPFKSVKANFAEVFQICKVVD